MGDDDGCCCGCCLGLALGYLLFSGSAHAVPVNPEKTSTRQSGIEQVVDGQKKDNFLLRQIDNYQQNIGPQMKADLGVENVCRYEPSCSEYAKLAVEKHGQAKGGLLAAGRLARCNPLSKGGYDPVI